MTAHIGQLAVAWFIDTASLLTMAIDPKITAVVRNEIESTGGRMVLIDIVKEELEYRSERDSTADLAKQALTDIGRDWPWLSTESIDNDDVRVIQDDVADGRALRDAFEHWAESVIILLCKQAQDRQGNALDVRFLTEDFNARRVANRVPRMTPLTLHRLFRNRVQRGAMTSAEAAHLSKLIEDAARGPEMTEEDFQGPLKRLGRPGWP